MPTILKHITDIGVQVAIVIGGGNIYRGMNEIETGIESAHGDYMGMLATCNKWNGYAGYA